MKSRPQVRLFTLVQHSGFGFAGNPQFQHAVEEACLSSTREVERVRRAGGVILGDYFEASQRAELENYPPWVKGFIPHAAGTFAKVKIGGLRVYLPHPSPSGCHSPNAKDRIQAHHQGERPYPRRHYRHPADTPRSKQERAAAVFRDPHGFVHEKWEFLRQKGMSDAEILQALDTATKGEVLRATRL